MTRALAQGKNIMRDSIRRLFPTGRTLATALTHVSRGMAADALLEQGELTNDEAAIVLLPQFAIRDFEGSESVNRIQWHGEAGRTTRVVEYGQTANIGWQVEDSSLPVLTGNLSVTVDITGVTISGDVPPMLNIDIAGNETALRRAAKSSTVNPIEPTAIHVHTQRELTRHLRKISEHGREEMFLLFRLLHSYARDAVNSASIRVYREIHDTEVGNAKHIIDEIERESVLDQLMLGEHQTDSVVIRMIRRVAATDVTVRKSVMQFMATAIWSGAETQVRNHIGDPHLGRVIRRLARQLQELTGIVEVDATEVLAAYKQEFPEQRVGMGRIVDALTAGASVHSQTVDFTIDLDPAEKGAGS